MQRKSSSRSACRRRSTGKRLTLDGRDSINPAVPGDRPSIRQRKRPGRARPFAGVRTVLDGVKLLCSSGDCRRTGVLASIGWKIRPSRETQCDCTGDDEDDSHLMSPLTSFGFVSVKLGVCASIFCAQDHKNTDFGIVPGARIPLPTAAILPVKRADSNRSGFNQTNFESLTASTPGDSNDEHRPGYLSCRVGLTWTSRNIIRCALIFWLFRTCRGKTNSCCRPS
jgi:hypothetical protein